MTDFSSIWKPFVTEQDLEVMSRSGHGASRQLQEPIALLVIDTIYRFMGHRNQHRDDVADTDYPVSCGPVSWEVADRLAGLLQRARDVGVKVIYTTGAPAHQAVEDATWGRKITPQAEAADINEIPDLLRPQANDVVIQKTAPSGFFSTPMVQYLTTYGIRQVVVCGATTSGCVRATAVDAFSHGYAVSVLVDGVFDRSEASHAVSLFDIGQKYASLLTIEELLSYFERSHSRR